MMWQSSLIHGDNHGAELKKQGFKWNKRSQPDDGRVFFLRRTPPGIATPHPCAISQQNLPFESPVSGCFLLNFLPLKKKVSNTHHPLKKPMWIFGSPIAPWPPIVSRYHSGSWAHCAAAVWRPPPLLHLKGHLSRPETKTNQKSMDIDLTAYFILFPYLHLL